MQLKTNGIILKQRNIGENDRIVTVLTQDMGLIEICARRSRSPKNPLTAPTQVLNYSSFCLYKGKAAYYIADTAESIRSFYDLRLDVVKLSLAGYFAELCAFLSPTAENGEELLRLILNTCHLLESDRYSMEHLRPVFELRALSASGFMPNLVCCAECNAYESADMLFLPLDGVLCCQKCYPLSDYYDEEKLTVPLSPAVLSAMRHIVFTDAQKIFSFRLSDRAATMLYDTARIYTALHTEADFKSLHLFDTMYGREHSHETPEKKEQELR